jgi:hypothetical protein
MINELKKASTLQTVNHALLAILNPEQLEVEIWRADKLDQRHELSSELGEMWCFIARKSNPRRNERESRSGSVQQFKRASIICL